MQKIKIQAHRFHNFNAVDMIEATKVPILNSQLLEECREVFVNR